MNSLSSQARIKKRILAYCVNPKLNSYLKLCLFDQYELVFSDSGKKAVTLAAQKSPSIIILGIDCSHQDSLETCRFLKKYPQTSHIPIVLLLENSIPREKLVNSRCQADTILEFPFQKEELLLQLNNWVNLQEAWVKRFAIGMTNNNGISKSFENSFIQKLNAIIEKHLDNENFQISDLCKEVGLSHMQIHRKLKALTGFSTANYIRNYRLKKSLSFLKHSDLTITEIAYNVGFRSINYFTKSFKNSFGQTPSKFRAASI